MLTSNPKGTPSSRATLFHMYTTAAVAATKVHRYIFVTHHQDLTHRPPSHQDKCVIPAAAKYRQVKSNIQNRTQQLRPRT
mmetsp:Transcript_114386/g.323353  ORF Transcript_114386/g.323353 Transcript_114386/m.323353 type:complete len:80 (+) Transcript_114386:951-1190(+)